MIREVERHGKAIRKYVLPTVDANGAVWMRLIARLPLLIVTSFAYRFSYWIVAYWSPIHCQLLLAVQLPTACRNPQIIA